MPRWMRFIPRLVRFILAWLAAAVATAVVGSALQTQRVLSRLDGVGADITSDERVSTTLYDLQHFATLYVIPITVGMLVALGAGLLVYRKVGFGRPLVFAVAGGVAMLVMLVAMKEAYFGVHLVGGAREAPGLALQALAGALGGLLFAALFPQRAR